MAEITKLHAKRKQAKCPICGKPTDGSFRPFCSRHCADVDLGRWLDGAYRIETGETPDQAAAEEKGREDE